MIYDSSSKDISIDELESGELMFVFQQIRYLFQINRKKNSLNGIILKIFYHVPMSLIMD